MTPNQFIHVLRLIMGLCLSLYGVVSGCVQYIDDQPAKALSTGVIWTLAGCIVAPLAEDVEDLIRDLYSRRKK